MPFNLYMKLQLFKNSISGLLSLLFVLTLFSGCKKQDSTEEDMGRTGDPTIDRLTEAIKENPNDPDLYLQRSEIFYNHQAYDQAIADLARVMKLDSMNLRAHHLLADVYMDSYQSARALQTMQRAAMLYPDSINTKLKLSEFQLILKQYDGALNTIADIMKISPGNPEGLFMLGIVYRDQGKTDLAIGAFQAAVERNPDITEAWVILGDLMDRTHNPLAIQYFDNAIRVSPKNVAAWHAKAYYLQNNGKMDEALAIYRQIHTLDAQYPEAYLNAGILLMYKDSLDKAMTEFNILSQIDPSNAAAWFYKGKTYHLKGQIDQAKASYEQALRLDPDYDQAKDGLKELEGDK